MMNPMMMGGMGGLGYVRIPFPSMSLGERADHGRE